MSGGSFFGYITIVTCAGHFIRSHRGQVQLPPIKLGVNATFSLILFLLMCSMSYTDFLQIHNLLRGTFVTPTNKAVKSQPAWSGNRANITQSKDSLLFITKKYSHKKISFTLLWPKIKLISMSPWLCIGLELNLCHASSLTGSWLNKYSSVSNRIDWIRLHLHTICTQKEACMIFLKKLINNVIYIWCNNLPLQ